MLFAAVDRKMTLTVFKILVLKIFNLSYGLKQLISEPTHLPSTSVSCIDLIFTNHPNMFMNSGDFPLPYGNCHHQLVFAEIDLNIFYPPPYTWLKRDFVKTNYETINNAIANFEWKKTFSNINIHIQVRLFNNI